jgi:predicted methyltransferase
MVWSDSRTLASGSESLALTSLSDTRDGAAVTLNFSAVKAVVVKNTHPTLTVTFSGAFTAWPLKPGGMVAIVDPSADGVTGNTLSVSGGNGVTYDIIVIGEGTVT